MTTTVNAATFRAEADHLFRLANVDYRACVSASEVDCWKDTAARALDEAKGLECRRATAYDRERFAKAIAAVTARLVEADTRIAQLKVPRNVKTVHNYPSLASLRGRIPTLCYGEAIRVRGNQTDFTAASVVGYALECDSDAYDAVLRNEELKGRTHWFNANATVLSANKAVMERYAARRAGATVLALGDNVIFEGRVFRLISAPNGNVELCRLTPDEVAALINSHLPGPETERTPGAT